MGRPEVVEARAGIEDPETSGGGRAQRADARRNRERLVAAARRVFAEEGGGASMEAIAQEAGVGVGTLYRHFPRRIDMVEAVYRDEVDELVHTAEQAVAELEPWPAVVRFLEDLVRYGQRKRRLLNELQEAFDKSPGLQVRSRQRLEQAMELVIGRGQRAGVLRTDLDGSDLLQFIGPTCASPTLSEDQRNRLLAMILDGLRRPSGTASRPKGRERA
jgi:AcrR family transcriptional regulator